MAMLLANNDLFADFSGSEILDDGATLLRGFDVDEAGLAAAIKEVTAVAQFRNMTTPGGHVMSAAMSNCGQAGWVTDRSGYRYTGTDPLTSNPWPAMPTVFTRLAVAAAGQAGYARFTPDACLINRYVPGARMTLHQDRNERDFTAPIVSVSLGLPAVFLWGGKARTGKPRRVALASGDVLVWGGASRLNFHGILALKDGMHDIFGRCRINLTFRKAL